MAKGYWIAVGAKPLHVVNETFYSIPTDDANFILLGSSDLRGIYDTMITYKKGGPMAVCRPPL